MAFHGHQILFGNIEGAGRFFESVGFQDGVFWAWVVGCLEFGCGIAARARLPHAPRGRADHLLPRPVAIVTHHWENGYNWEARGIEYPLFWAIVVFHFLVHGGGRWSVDRLIGREI